jgi:oligopeptide transport system permease protein
MIGFLIRRGLWMVVTLWAVFTISWVLMRNVPGGPFDRERALEPQQIAAMEARYHLDEPMLSQYWRELSLALRGDLGLSLKTDFHVNEVVAQGFPISAALGILALFFAIVLGLAAGIVSAVWRGSAFDYALMSLATVGIAIPTFTLGAIVVILFAFVWPILPAAGWGRTVDVILPAFCLGLPYAASIARLVRTGMLDVLNQDYIRTAYAKGLLPASVIMNHALKGALVPVASFLGPAVAGILTGSLIVEKIFAVPGLGVHFIEAALQRDYTLAMGMVLIYTVMLYVLNTLVDISYSFLDPRVKLE